MTTPTAILILLAISAPSAFADSGIPWDASVRLQIEDFQAVPAPEFEGQAALSVVTLGMKPVLDATNGLTYTMQCDFSPTHSWMTADDADLLEHERAHFDLAEDYARRLHHAFQAYLQKAGAAAGLQGLNEIYERIRLEHRRAQTLYDSETRHGTIPRQQRLWLRRIRRDLEKSADDASYPRS